MTVIVGLIDRKKGKVYMGADSQMTYGYLNTESGINKIVKKGKMLIGFSGSAKSLSLIKHSFRLPAHPKGMDVDKYMTTKFVPALRNMFKRERSLRTLDHGDDVAGESTYLIVAYRKELFRVFGHFHASKVMRDYAATGCGYELALGSFNTSSEESLLGELNIDPLQRINMALEAACEHSAGCSPPFVIEKV